MEEKKKVGLITYHSAYNFGSVLQAYATKTMIERLGFDVETIDYRTPSQTYWYTTEASIRLYGRRMWLWDSQFYLKRLARLRRRKRFENFISTYLHPTHPTLRSYEEVCNADFRYDILVCGSDQIWNPWCTEFFAEDRSKALLPYFLKFGTANKRISYASSFGTDRKVIEPGVKNLDLIDRISVREAESASLVSKLTGREVTHVCDPTLLLQLEDYKKLGLYKPKIKSEYLLIYNLNWKPAVLRAWLPAIKQFAKEHNWKVVLISPLHYSSDSEVTVLHDAGPLDFLSYLSNASFVVTTTFHGTMFSLNFERPFVSCSTDVASRQGQVLQMCGMGQAIVNDPNDLSEAANKMLHIDFTRSNDAIAGLRESSIAYLKKALTE